MDRFSSRLGEPDLRLAGFQLWIHGPRTVDVRPYYDWLNVTAHCGAQGASVWVSGEILELRDLTGWLAQTDELYRTLSGVARLAPLEPNLSLLLSAGSKGHLELVVEITPDHLSQSHRFEFSLDQSYLPLILTQGRKLLDRFLVPSVPSRA